MRILFLVFHGFSEYNGISKKIRYQVNGLKENGHKVTLCSYIIDENGYRKRMVDESVLENYGSGFLAKIRKRVCYNAIANYAIQNNIELVYMRSDHNANPFTIHFLRKLKVNGIRTVMEIPTYPYDDEYKNLPFSFKLNLYIDKFFRNRLAKQTINIVTFSKYERIFGVPTINISNGIDFKSIKLKNHLNKNYSQINLIGVAEIHPWHGFDRVIIGLSEYYKTNPKIKVQFNIVGEGDHNEIEKLKRITVQKGMDDYVIFHGTKFGKELDELFDLADMGIASLARHRSNITYIKTLKNREYAARGIPFVYSEIDEDFENMPYIIKAPANEEPLNIQRIIDFYKGNNLTPSQIRSSIEKDLSWESQMKKVLNQINYLL